MLGAQIHQRVYFEGKIYPGIFYHETLYWQGKLKHARVSMSDVNQRTIHKSMSRINGEDTVSSDSIYDMRAIKVEESCE
jgi:hypothetical protein